MGFIKTLIGGAAGFMLGGPIGAAIGAGIGGSLDAGEAQEKGIERAAGITAASTREAIAAEERKLERLIELQEPFRETGVGALPQLAEMARGGGEPINVEDLPTFEIQQRENEQAINRALAGRGIFGSRAGVDALGRSTERLIAEETGRESDRRFGRLLDLVNIGRGAATTQSAGVSSSNVPELITSGGGTLAELQALKGQSRASTFANIGALPLQALQIPGLLKI